MGLFSGIINNWKKSEAAAIIQNLLEISQKNMGAFGFSPDPAQTATSLIQSAWEAMPHVFSGEFGQRPHKLATAAIALAYGIQHTTDEDNRAHFLIALGSILNEVEANGSFYPFNSIDERLLVNASRLFTEKANAPHPYDDLPGNKDNDEIQKQWTGSRSDFPYETFGDWYFVYRESASKTNKALCAVDGLYLLDMVEKEPLYKAFNDLIDPVSLGQAFGRSFDPLNMKWDFDSK